MVPSGLRAKWKGRKVRKLLFGLWAAAFAALAPAAWTQTSITIAASPTPIVDAQINGQPVRLEIDLRASDFLLLNPQVADRLHVLRLIGLRLSIDSGASIRGRVARPRIVFAQNQTSQKLAGIFAIPVTSRADGVIGPGVLPQDVVTIVMGPEAANAHDLVLPLADADHWQSHAMVGGLNLNLGFNLGAEESVFNTTAASTFNDHGAITSDGPLVDREVILGLTAKVQPVRTELTVLGLALNPALARTSEPLHGAQDDNTIVVTAHTPPPPGMSLGRAALAHCSSISVNRHTRQLTLRCAA